MDQWQGKAKVSVWANWKYSTACSVANVKGMEDDWALHTFREHNTEAGAWAEDEGGDVWSDVTACVWFVLARRSCKKSSWCQVVLTCPQFRCTE